MWSVGIYIIIVTCIATDTSVVPSDNGTTRRPLRRARNISKLAYTCDYDASDYSKDVSPEATPPRRGPGRRKRKRIPSMRIRLLGRHEGTNSPIFSAETLDVSSCG